MNKNISLILLLTCCSIGMVNGQKNIYSTTGGEWIFSWANAQQKGYDINTITRFSPVVNIQSQLHMM